MSERADSYVLATTEAIKQNKESRNNRAVSAARMSLREWLLRHRRATAALGLVGVVAVGCGSQTAPNQTAPSVSSHAATPSPESTPVANAKMPFPCGHGGSPGLTSTDPNVQNFTGLTPADMAKLFSTDVPNIDQCNAPDFTDQGGVPPGTITSAEFQELSTGDRAVVYVRHVTQGQDSIPGTSESAYQLIASNPDNSAGYFSWGVSDAYGQRTYQGAVSALADKPGSPHIVTYQAVIDRPITEGSPSMYEIDTLIYNGPANDDLSRLTQSQIVEQVGEWMNDKVVRLPS